MFRTVLTKVRPVHAVMMTVFLTGLVVAGYKFLDAQEIATLLLRLNGWSVPLLLALPAVYLWLKSMRYADLFGFSGVSFNSRDRRLTEVSYASAQMATLIPGGYVARIGLMESCFGLGAKAVIPTLLEKFFDITLLMVVGLYACSFIPGTAHLSGGLVAILALIAVVCTSRTLRGALSEKTIRLLSKVGAERIVRTALEGENPGFRVSLKIVLFTVAVLVSELAISWASFAALDLWVSPVALVMAYAVADVVGRIAPTPGGVGLTELGMVAILHSVDGMDVNHAAAATFLFRILIYLLPALYGGLFYLFVWAPMSAKRQNPTD